MRIMSKRHSATFSTERERESCPHSSLSESVPLPAGMLTAELNWTEKGTNQSMKWSRLLRSLKSFIRLNNTFATDTTLLLSKAGLTALTFPFSHPFSLLRQWVLVSNAIHSCGNPIPQASRHWAHLSPHVLPPNPHPFSLSISFPVSFSCHVGDCPTLF